MASLFEQYEQASQKTSSSTRRARPDLVTSGFINLKLEEEAPIFNKQRINFKPTHPTASLAVSNNQLALVMSNKVLLRIDLSKKDPQPEEIDLMKFGGDKYNQSKVGHLFMDSKGNHLLISLISRDGLNCVDALHLGRGSKKPKSTGKMKSHVVTAIAWGRNNASETNTGPILIGTSRGFIFETELSTSDSSFASVEQYWKQVFDIGKGNPVVITGLEFFAFSGKDTKHFVLVTTPSRLYQFVGQVGAANDPPVTQAIFTLYSEAPERFLEIPSNLPYSQLQVFCPSERQPPKSFAWMTGEGILHGSIDCSGEVGPDAVLKDTKLLQFKENKSGNPLGIVITEFHILVLFSDSAEIWCILNEDLVMKDLFTETYGPMVKMVKDTKLGTLWACAEYAVYKYQITNEARNVWQIYLERNEYGIAKQLCGDNPENVDLILRHQAHDCFTSKKYEESAVLYAQTQASFEEITLRFLQAEQYVPLRTFLLRKLAGLRPQDRTQLTMIVSWIVELYLQQLGELRDSSQRNTAAYSDLSRKFRKFLEEDTVKKCVNDNQGTIYDLIAGHGDQDNLIYFSNLMKDYKKVLHFHIQNNQFKEALDTLRKQNDPELFYEFSPTLMQVIPTETVDAWIAQKRHLNPSRLIPAMVHYEYHNPDCYEKNEVVRYLEFCIRTLDVQDQAIHNYMVSMYARMQPDKLVPFLLVQGQDPNNQTCDLKYVLRICAEHGNHRACVHVYSAMGLYEEAVELALKFDIDLAKENADKPEDNDELRKKLWLKIACHVVKDENDIKRAMEFLQECELLKIEDILPFFPDFTTIDHFKDAICQSLQEYNLHIEGLKEEMEEATQSASEIRSEIQSFRSRHANIKAQDTCSVCLYPILARAFYLFPCHHMFHVDCLVSEVRPHLSSTKQHRLEDLQKQLASFSSREDGGAASLNSATISARSPRDKLKAEIDDIIASECVYCGDIMIRCIDLPFIDPSEYEDVLREWE